MTGPLHAVAAALIAEGGLLASAVTAPAPDTPAPHGAMAASGSRAAADPIGYAEIVEAVREGHLTHLADGPSRIVTTADADLALLVGDRLYALGLSRLADRGDLDAVAALADVIVLGAQAHATGDLELAEAAWDAGALVVGRGATAPWREARTAARSGDPTAVAALRAAARQLAAAGAATP